MTRLTARVANELSALRSIALVCMALITTNAFYRLNAPLPGRLSSGVLEWINIRSVTDSLVPGAHLVSPRRFYLHHGIYLGDGEVAHYSGFSGALRSGPIEVTDLAHFAHDKPVWMLAQPAEYSRAEVAERARSRVGENRYRVLTNNCEHFCRWCVSGRSYSAQVEACLRRPRSLLAFISALQPRFVA
ncbi:lecithin retinol acyltransferase family protein [Pseudomonas citri]|uniref:lecithin retinol acyltransferase family protein n=1 Tax=Pseudomonas citri TaxID=2978349 RepID=UPI0021B6402B|nr:lecithin retinol acyltransferase family protein [Pseudomonas citri]